ncbi:MAG TPA: hypothetical protein VE988_20225 [Gemmataceae bacterium]|nr:hypothetical protein [Gemmataceae bacterium]
MSSPNMGVAAPPRQRSSAANIDLDASSGLPLAQELVLLRQENADLRKKVEELDQLLNLAIQDAEDRLTERQREYESLLEEKSEVIRSLHTKNAELREQAADAAVGIDNTQPPDQQDLIRLQRELAEQRRQVEGDQESMMGQMRDMEMALAKDRAELARQRAELQRLQDEVKHEVENAARDGGLRERLVAIQRRSNAFGPRPGINQNTPLPDSLPKPPTASDKITKSGLFRRIFGQ